MTAPKRSSSKVSSARWRSVARISAETSTGDLSPATVRSATMPGASTKSYGSRPRPAMSARPRPMKRLTETMVLRGSTAASRQRLGADLPRRAASPQVAHRRRQDARGRASSGRHSAHAVAHRGDQRMGGAEVDADGDAPLVRVGRLAGFGDLQQGHRRLSCDALPVPARRARSRRASRRRSMSSRKRSTNISARTCAAAAAARVVASSSSVRSSRVEHRGAFGGDFVGERLARRPPSAASSSASRHCICCIRNSTGIAVLFSASTGAPRSSHR